MIGAMAPTAVTPGDDIPATTGDGVLTTFGDGVLVAPAGSV